MNLPCSRSFALALCALAFGLASPPAAQAHGSGAAKRLAPAVVAQSAFAVRGALPAPAAGTSELKFRDIFRMPVGPRGLELTARVRELDGKRVRMVGYMVEREANLPGSFYLSPLPALISDDDESLADDLPPSTIMVQLAPGVRESLAYMPGLLHFTGTLRVSPVETEDGRVAAVRLELDEATSTALDRLSDGATAVAAH